MGLGCLQSRTLPSQGPQSPQRSDFQISPIHRGLATPHWEPAFPRVLLLLPEGPWGWSLPAAEPQQRAPRGAVAVNRTSLCRYDKAPRSLRARPSSRIAGAEGGPALLCSKNARQCRCGSARIPDTGRVEHRDLKHLQNKSTAPPVLGVPGQMAACGDDCQPLLFPPTLVGCLGPRS